MIEKFMISKKLLRQIDFSIIILTIAIIIFGAMNIYSATHNKYGMSFFYHQLLWMVVGLIVMYFILVFDYSMIGNYANILYALSILLLFLNDTVLKKTVNGAGSWLKIGGFSMQPSELAKLAMILIIAKKIYEMEGNINNVKNFFNVLLYAAIPMILIIIQPDMGMTAVCFFIVLGMFFAAGLNIKVILGGITGLIGLIALVWNSPLMETYWKVRLTSFIYPEADELGAGLQLIQSQIGIGSGGILGKGFLKGTQISGGFIPEAHTDFIFSVVGEEWGLIGAAVLLLVYGIIIYKIIKIAKSSKDTFGTLICIGVVSSILFSIAENICMTIGLAPITGITLPFMSYGGSSILTNFMALALVLNVGMRRKKINF